MADIDEFVGLHDDPEVTRFIRRLDRSDAEELLRLTERDWLERGHGMTDLFGRSAAWFRQHASDDAPRASLHGPTV